MSSPSAPDWLDWHGATALVIATGPSAEDAPLDAARGRTKAIAVKSAWQLAPWADALYGCEIGWWVARKGCPQFAGWKASASPSVCKVYGMRRIKLRPCAEILTQQIGTVGAGLPEGGGHSGFHALNLAVQFGATRILLAGFDMTVANGSHFSGYDEKNMALEQRCIRWREALDGCAGRFRELGVEVVNCAPRSALAAYPKVPLAEALSWL